MPRLGKINTVRYCMFVSILTEFIQKFYCYTTDSRLITGNKSNDCHQR